MAKETDAAAERDRFLREAEEKYRAVIDGATFAIAVTRMPEGTWVSVNDAFLRLFELAREEVIGWTSIELGLSELSQAEIAAGLREHRRIHNLEVARQTKSGARRILSLNIDPVVIAEKEHLLTTALDITEQKRTDEEHAGAIQCPASRPL
jgi:PAS domain S-box-containing protein